MKKMVFGTPESLTRADFVRSFHIMRPQLNILLKKSTLKPINEGV